MELKDKILNVFWGRNIGTEKSWEALADCIVDVCQEEIAWMKNELSLAEDRVKELELEIMLHDEMAYGEPGRLNGVKLNIKKRRNFR